MKKSLTLISLAMVMVVGKPSYPVKDLDNCRDQSECETYCNVAENKPACWAYQKYTLQTQVLGDATGSATFVFPIAELGNCNNALECRAYCAQSDHHLACVAYSATRNSGQGQKYLSMLKLAATKLGCSSLASCKAICDLPENKTKCETFAHNFAPLEIRQRVETSLTKLGQIESQLGCTSASACSLLCHDPANHDKCRAVFENSSSSPSGKLMDERIKLGVACTTAGDCEARCKEHPNLCPTLHLGNFDNSSRSGEKPSAVGLGNGNRN